MTAQAQTSEPIINAMSIDVEDYYHVSAFDGIVPRTQWDHMESRVVANTTRLLDLFEEFGVRSTWFVLGWVCERHPDLVANIAQRGHEVASHGYAHRLIYDQTPKAFREDVRRAKHLLEEATGQRIHGYRAPSYSITPRSLWALDILLEEGHTYDSSIYPIRHDRYGIPVSERQAYPLARTGGTLFEVPGSTTTVAGMNLPIGGGGYFRILPYWWTRWGIARLNQDEGRPAVFYLHPWEIDPEQPRLKVGVLSNFRHYRNLDNTESRLRQLLRDFRFDTVSSLVERCRREYRPDSVAALPLPYCW